VSWRELSQFTLPAVAGTRCKRLSTDGLLTSWSKVILIGAAVETSFVPRSGA